MKKLAIINTMTTGFHKTGLRLKKHSPEILVVAGVIGTVTSAVMACKATLKVNDILTDTRDQLDKIHECASDPHMSKEYTAEDAKKDTTIVYAQTGVKLVKLYGPSIALGVLSITSILASNNILRKRNVALAAAYTTIDKSFKEYRNRVIERFGKEVDHELKYNIKKQKVEEVVTDPETGKEKKIKKTVDVAGPELASPYARFYDDGCTSWEKDPEANLFFLRAEQNLANDRLRARGYLFLNEVYERLGIPTTKAGQIVGWIYDPENPDHQGDDYVDFGIYDINREKSRDFVNGYERVILLDFNVDGPILDQIESHRR